MFASKFFLFSSFVLLGPPVKSFLETVKKIRENNEHLVPRPFTLNNNDRTVRMVSVCFYLVWREKRRLGERK
jgi:hypothetical protein